MRNPTDLGIKLINRPKGTSVLEVANELDAQHRKVKQAVEQRALNGSKPQGE